MSSCTQITLAIFNIVASLAPAVAALVIGSMNKDIECDDEAFISLSDWLITYGSVNLGITVFLILSFVGVVVGASNRSLLGVFTGGVFVMSITVLSLMWVVSWNIVGAVLLFKHSMDCIDACKPVWIMTCVALALQWISLLTSCKCSVKCNNDV